ncbi:dephospho-CoA kinase [Bifidobacterium lemurum]|uniref:Dephospho-CoA kinase n=1 Tax=Bifidobacterium lemurum TaxID=1603886 RepID=A0A261FUM5_9BIFI|nr:dephospho-CoA kinase [Bifidobacterium lemurum]OZG62456.1 dephospho-CoA kinase [Bifidobacterium lemurum]QOL33799.1 dephospho-CoA kinase [Bifidobacterium lemurum]
MTVRVGLTGGIAAGKSTVAARLRQLGAFVIDDDALARKVVEPGSVGLARIAREFGPESIAPDGTLDRAWMADHVFGAHAEPGARERLDAIEHPLIYAESQRLEREAIAAHESKGGVGRLVIVHDVPLLAEVIGTMPFDFDHVVTVEAPEELRIARMMGERGMTREQAEARIRHQSSREEREAIADVVIDSTQPLERMLEQVDGLYARWRVQTTAR